MKEARTETHMLIYGMSSSQSGIGFLGRRHLLEAMRDLEAFDLDLSLIAFLKVGKNDWISQA